MYMGFFGMAALSLLPAAHGAYRWRKAEKKVSRGAKAFLLILSVLYGCAVASGAIVAIIGAEQAASHAMGLIALVLSLWFDYRCKRICDDAGSGEV
ncbi:MAG: hypothetical protein J5482_01250 [Oscillospiraceae bacterium]|nr:hypothetical protein [Oscillospiraceae bacterium]